MKIDPLLIYFWQLADTLRGCFWFIAISTLIIGFIFLFCSLDDDYKVIRPDLRNFSKKLFISGFIFLSLAVLTPSSKTIAMMVVIPAIANSEVIQKDVPELYSLAIDALKENLTQKEESK